MVEAVEPKGHSPTAGDLERPLKEPPGPSPVSPRRISTTPPLRDRPALNQSARTSTVPESLPGGLAKAGSQNDDGARSPGTKISWSTGDFSQTQMLGRLQALSRGEEPGGPTSMLEALVSTGVFRGLRRVGSAGPSCTAGVREVPDVMGNPRGSPISARTTRLTRNLFKAPGWRHDDGNQPRQGLGHGGCRERRQKSATRAAEPSGDEFPRAQLPVRGSPQEPTATETRVPRKHTPPTVEERASSQLSHPDGQTDSPHMPSRANEGRKAGAVGMERYNPCAVQPGLNSNHITRASESPPFVWHCTTTTQACVGEVRAALTSLPARHFVGMMPSASDEASPGLSTSVLVSGTRRSDAVAQLGHVAASVSIQGQESVIDARSWKGCQETISAFIERIEREAKGDDLPVLRDGLDRTRAEPSYPDDSWTGPGTPTNSVVRRVAARGRGTLASHPRSQGGAMVAAQNDLGACSGAKPTRSYPLGGADLGDEVGDFWRSARYMYI